MTVEFDSIPFDDLAVEIFGAKQAADSLAGDRANHQQGDKGELMGHLENDQDGGDRRTNSPRDMNGRSFPSQAASASNRNDSRKKLGDRHLDRQIAEIWDFHGMVWAKKAPRPNKRIRSEGKMNTLQKSLPDVSTLGRISIRGWLMIGVVW